MSSLASGLEVSCENSEVSSLASGLEVSCEKSEMSYLASGLEPSTGAFRIKMRSI